MNTLIIDEYQSIILDKMWICGSLEYGIVKSLKLQGKQKDQE